MPRLYRVVGVLEDVFGVLLILTGYLLYDDLLGLRDLLGLHSNVSLYSSMMMLVGFLSLIGGLLLIGRKESPGA